jgi:hypothetical protein
VRRALAFLFGLALFAHAYDARAQSCGGNEDAGDDAGCAFNQYCAYPDGGAILDGAAGVCDPEPCVVSTDCPNDEICDTSQNPFACVECISGSDCPGILVCDTSNHTCVNPPSEDGGEDASALDAATDASPASDAAADAAVPPKADASVDAGAASDASGDANAPPPLIPPDQGTLGGGAWDCGLASAQGTPLAALALPLAFVALFFARRRSRQGKSDD